MSESTTQHRLALQKKVKDMTKQPLELYHLSHDLRGPLNSILGFTELLLEGIEGPLNENQEEDLAAIYQSAQKLLGLINNIVDFSKLEADRLSFNQSAVNLARVIESVAQRNFGLDKAEEIEIVTDLPESIPLIYGDRSRVEQMLLSFLHFAFKHRKSGQITLTTEVGSEEVTIKVNISGLILSEEKIADMFRLIVNVDSTGRSELGIGGIDLPLTQLIVTQHQGKVWAESDDSSGTTFHLVLPIYQDQEFTS